MGTGNIGTDLMHKLLRSEHVTLGAMIGNDPDSEGLERARRLGVEATSDGINWLLAHRDEFDLVVEATSERVHREHAPRYEQVGLQVIDLTPAALGPAVVPVVNLDANLQTPNINLITCGGQATIPIVDAVARVAPVAYAEIVSAVASRSAGPGTRQNIDAFTRKTADGLSRVGGAKTGKAIIVLNPAAPPITMRNTVYCALSEPADEQAVSASIIEAVARVQKYVPGYRLKAEPLFDANSFQTPGGVAHSRVTVLLEVEGAGDYLPPYAGNLDIMTAAAVQVAETVLSRRSRVDTAEKSHG
jgi:acetaldehyde dehydrogenase